VTNPGPWLGKKLLSAATPLSGPASGKENHQNKKDFIQIEQKTQTWAYF
jgi:hypothetical protein